MLRTFLKSVALPCTALLMAVNAPAGTVTFERTSLSSSDPTLFRHTYSVEGVVFGANHEFDVLFPADLFADLTNGTAAPGFDVRLFQPGNPPGSPGHYTALALIDVGIPPSFSVDLKYLGLGEPPPQRFYINEFEFNPITQEREFTQVLLFGDALPASLVATPEPGAFAPCGLVLVVGGVWSALRRRHGTAAKSN